MNNRFNIVCPQCHQDNGFDKPSERPAACKNCGAPIPDSLAAEKQKVPIGIVITDKVSKKYFDLKFFELAFFGRDQMGNKLFFDHVDISRRHFLIKMNNNQYYIQDVGSKDGTFFEINGKKTECKEPVVLQDGGTIILGRSPFSVKILY